MNLDTCACLLVGFCLGGLSVMVIYQLTIIYLGRRGKNET